MNACSLDREAVAWVRKGEPTDGACTRFTMRNGAVSTRVFGTVALSIPVGLECESMHNVTAAASSLPAMRVMEDHQEDLLRSQ